MSAGDEQFEIKKLLDALRADWGDIKFGYQMQGFFAHVLLNLGARIHEVNAQGHPDVKATLQSNVLAIQVKSCAHEYAGSFQLMRSDFDGITMSPGTIGYLAFLDCAIPVSWHVVEASVIGQFLGRSVPIATIRAARDEQLSQDCTDIFAQTILSAKNRLSTLPFSLLSRWALEGKNI